MTWGSRPSKAFHGRVNFSAGGVKSERERERERERDIAFWGGFVLLDLSSPPLFYFYFMVLLRFEYIHIF